MKTVVKFIVLLSIPLLLAACTTTQTFSQLAANQLRDVVDESDEFVSALFASPSDISLQANDSNLPGPLANFMAVVDPQQASVQCFIDANSSPDVDGDTVPANAFFSVDCSYQDGTDTVTLMGTMTARDDDDGDPTSGYDVTISDFEFRIETPNALFVRSFDMIFDLDKGVGNSYSASYDVEYTKIGPFIGTATLDYEGNHSYTPDNAADPFAAGTFTLDDLLRFFRNDRTYNVTRTSDDLHFSSTCVTDNKFDDGVVTYEGSDESTLVVDYTACGTATGTYTSGPVLAGF